MTVYADRIEHEIRIDAPPDTVLAYVIDPDTHGHRMGPHAELDARPATSTDASCTNAPPSPAPT